MKPYLIILKEFWQRYPKSFLINIILNIISGIIEGLALFTMAPLVDFFLGNSPSNYSPPTLILISFFKSVEIIPSTQSFFIAVISLVLIKSMFLLLCRFYGLKTKFDVLQDFLLNLLKSLFHSNPNFFSQNKQGEIIQICFSGLVKTGDTFGATIHLCAALIRTIVYLGAIFYFSKGIVLYALLLVVVGYLPFKLIGRISYNLGKNDVAVSSQYIVALQEALSGAKLILGLGKSNHIVNQVNEKYQHVKKNTIRSALLGEFITLSQEPITLILIFVLMYIATTKLGRSSGEVLIMLYSFRMALTTISMLLNLKNQFDQNYPGYEQIKNIITQANLHEQKSGNLIFNNLEKQIEFKEYSFSYNQTEILKNINFSLKKSQKIALVGPSGSGKTTMADALLGLCSPKYGNILIDGNNLFSFQMKSWREKIGYVPQKPFLFNATIKENLLWGNPEATLEDIWWALKLAEASSFVSQLSLGIETCVGESGGNLSGGQQQRLTLARAFLRRSEIYILDEATSALDSHTEQQIIRNIRLELKDKTVIFVSHRLKTMCDVDSIIFLKDGEIIESGTYQQLLNDRKSFYKMVISQQ